MSDDARKSKQIFLWFRFDITTALSSIFNAEMRMKFPTAGCVFMVIFNMNSLRFLDNFEVDFIFFKAFIIFKV